MKNRIPSILLALMMSSLLFANNVTVTNITLTGQNTSSDYTTVQFDLSWENSWRDPVNYDAVWIFVKYQVGNGEWNHALLNTTSGNHSVGSENGVSSEIEVGTTSGNGIGVFLKRSANGTGNINWDNVQLRWEYGSNGVADDDLVTVKVFAIEMVYVPTASFYVGSGGGETSAFHAGGTTDPYQITSEGDITVSNLSSSDLYYDGDGDQTGPVPANFPKGYAAFYCMKYEVSQEQYVDFLNCLNYDQQERRTRTVPSSTADNGVMGSEVPSTNTPYVSPIGIETAGTNNSTPAVYVNNFDGDTNYDESNDGATKACAFLYWHDAMAYLDWAGLRPMTELEFEKACRGDQSPIADEYAWGNPNVHTSDYSIGNEGTSTEVPASPSTGTTGNANNAFSNHTGYNDGIDPGGETPLRCGIFATSTSSRIEAGASHYGIMEMSGNLTEPSISVGHSDGRSYTGVHGDGSLDTNGDADVTNWPVNNGISLRGGGMHNSYLKITVSDRTYGAESVDSPGSISTEDSNNGARGVRTAN